MCSETSPSTMTKLGLAAAAAAVTLGACAPVDHGMGEALKYDMALQTINPQPVYGPNALQPGYSGNKAQNASERYRKGAQVNEWHRTWSTIDKGGLSTTEGVSQGGGGSR